MPRSREGRGAEWEATLRDMPGVKNEEMEWTGLKDWLEGRGRVSKTEVAEYVHAHRVQVGEVEHGGAGTPTSAEGIRTWLVNNGDADNIDADEMERLSDEAERAAGATRRRSRTSRRRGPSHLFPQRRDSEAVLEEIRRLGYQVHEDDVTGQPYLAHVDENTGVATEVADGDAPDRVRDLLHELRAGPLSPPKYPQHVEPGGQNYRELLLTLAPHGPTAKVLAGRKAIFEQWAPKIAEVDKAIDDHLYGRNRTGDLQTLQDLRDQYTDMRDRMADERAGEIKEGDLYRSSHWDEKNVMAHIRFDDRTGPNGERMLHLAELQSDWHQQGRRQGYQNEAKAAARKAFDDYGKMLGEKYGLNPLQNLAMYSKIKNMDPAEVAEYERLQSASIAADMSGKTVPDAPFKTTWPEFAMKRMLRYAAERGYDALSWDTGETQAERYNMQKVADQIVIDQHEPGVFDLIASKAGGTVMKSRNLSDERLSEYVGKDMAQKAAQKQGLSELPAMNSRSAARVCAASTTISCRRPSTS